MSTPPVEPSRRIEISNQQDHVSLFVVATPIGNLSDMVPRAIEVLQSVDLIAAEDTRHAAGLLAHFGITTQMVAYHAHNEQRSSELLMQKIHAGQSVALISDAGTPLVSDPGFDLVRSVRQAGFRVVAVPGPCAAIAALSAAGIPASSFSFFGFPPAKVVARKALYESLAENSETLVFYESPHRILASLADAKEAFGEQREAMLARELTKRFESWYGPNLGEISSQLFADRYAQKGEMVLVVRGAPNQETSTDSSLIEKHMRLLVPHLGVKKASQVTAELLQEKKADCYQLAIRLAL